MSQGNPVSEALFNFVNAWSLMFWPLLLADRKRTRVKRKILWWTVIMVRDSPFVRSLNPIGPKLKP